MKKLSIILSLVIMAFVYTPGSFAGNHHKSNNGHKFHKVEDWKGGKKTTGVPLDGGLLALLAGAGVTYFAARKKKKNEQ